MCENNHRNENVRANRKKCAIENCSALLVAPTTFNEMASPTVASDDSENLSKSEQQVPNIKANEQVEIGMGAEPFNPNTYDRIVVILKRILENTGMYRKYSVEFIVEDDSIEKKIIDNPENRTWILLSCDGLPLKHLINIIEDNYRCIDCGTKLEHVSEITKHSKDTDHKSFYQPYACIIPNYGQFHYSQCMLRNYIKLNWDIEYESLCQALSLDSPKALAMIRYGQDYRKTEDFSRITRISKQREMVYPFTKHCLQNNLDPYSVENFNNWIETHVKDETYLSVLRIEKYFGTALHLYKSSARANNYEMLNVAKRVFSTLFHLVNAPNYQTIDLYSEYLDELMIKNNPSLYEYLEQRRFRNKTGRDYRSSPYDESHEESHQKK